MALPGTGNVNQGLQVFGGRSFGTTDNFSVPQVMAVDDSAQNYSATDTSDSGAGSALRTVTNFKALGFDSTPTRSAQTVSMTTTYQTTDANFTIKGISIHNQTLASVSATTNTLIAGIANQSITKTSSFKLAITLQEVYTDNS